MKNKFTYRSGQTEQMDVPGIPRELLQQNLRELDLLNHVLGGHSATLEGIKKLITDKGRSYQIADLGSGSGDSLKQIALWARKNKVKVILTGVDNKADAIDYLCFRCSRFPEIQGLVSDYKDYLNKTQSPDIILCSLFCHHLSDIELVWLFQKLAEKARVGFIVNDLERNKLAWHGAKILTTVLKGTSLSKNDGPISVLRGFKREELHHLLKQAGIQRYELHQRWAFRYLIIARSSVTQSNRHANTDGK
ncbi:MAG: hypothetical protein AB2L20_24935 [Mangrovibacterium sp.]